MIRCQEDVGITSHEEEMRKLRMFHLEKKILVEGLWCEWENMISIFIF
jgi:hypothetical protein